MVAQIVWVVLSLVAVWALFFVVRGLYRPIDVLHATRAIEVCVCPNCVAPLVREGAELWTPPPGRKLAVNLQGQVVADPGDDTPVLCRFVQVEQRDIPWGRACDAHPTDDHRQATNFVTVRADVVERRTARRRSLLAPLYRLHVRIKRALWWRSQLRANAVHGPELSRGGGEW